MQELNNNQKEHPDLYKRSIKGGYWVFAIRAATQALGFAKSIIVFNFLFNQNLELIIVANLLMAILTTSTESGFHAALIQKKDDIADSLDTAWVIDIVRGVLLFALIYLIAPWFASFRVTPEDVPLAIGVIRAMGACFLIRAFQNIGIVYFQKELQFHKTFWLTMAGTLTDIVLSIVLVLVFKSVWGYVIAHVAAAVVNLAMSYLMCPYRPKFHFVPEKARQLWKFGKWLFGGNIIGYLLNEGDDWFVWFYLGGGPLKLYRYAYNFANMPATHITNTISLVSFPAYSKIQHDLPRLREAYLKVLQATALISVPMAFLIFVLGPDFVRLFLVKESHAMIPIIQILAFKGFLTVFGSNCPSLFRALGKPKYSLYLMCICFTGLLISIYPFTKMWGITGTALSTIFASLATGPWVFYMLKELLQCSIWKLLRPWLLPVISSLVFVLTIALLKVYVYTETNSGSFFCFLVIAILLYIFSLWVLDCIFKNGLRQASYDHLFSFLKPCLWRRK
jgi:O-antigen/teichoic acid export membrane protein